MKKKTVLRLAAAAVSIVAAVLLYVVGIVPNFAAFPYLVFVCCLVFLYLVSGGRLHSFVEKIVIIFISFCIVFTIADMALRPVRNRKAFHHPGGMAVTQRLLFLPALLRYKPNLADERVVYGQLAASAIPLEERELRTVKFRADSYGFTNRETVEDRVYDILILSDSFGVAMEFDGRRKWVDTLHERYGFNVYNLSVSGISPWAEYVSLLVSSQRLKTHEDTIVLWAVFAGNDLVDYYGPVAPWGRLSRRERTRALKASLNVYRNQSALRLMTILAFSRKAGTSAGRILERTAPDGNKTIFFGPYVNARDRSREEVEAHPNYPRLVETVAAMKELARERDYDVKVILLPSKEEVYAWVLEGGEPWTSPRAPTGFSAALEAAALANGMEYLDIKPFMIDESRRAFESAGKMLWWNDDTHMSPDGSDAAASIIYENILKKPGK